ncbi:putative gpi-anchored cell wall beta- -endoglucanase protein [Eutypa lata UCREL1]|uniref:Probable glucan endo-1,3-beta-glucosidase eglC n=1 Tax=Eutypa lata (strain UCR-EL1) TaxID=1287681 RepID=M7TEY2_EUTLA|nr:putative gpi-anchored cell wall beta- -endoglucanase protein [Eutypa lata UCREL1]
MRTAATVLSLATAASAAVKGFNYGSTFTTGAAKMQADFEDEFTTAANLEGTSGFTSARLYTMVQGGTASDPISAIPAAIKTKTSLLLGLWASGGDTSFANELNALKAAIAAHGSDLGGLVDGISVGSEDLYRNSPQGIQAGSNVGAEPDTIARYIQETRDAIAGTPLEGSPVGHVDTWTAWYNGSNQAVIDACDWLGMDAYPYFQDTMANAIGQSGALFSDALAKTTQAGGGSKAVWITETGHPVSGDTVGQSVASVENAETYWKDVGCPLFDTTNVWWYTLQDASPDTPSPSFGIVGSDLSTTPLFDLSCDDAPASASSAIASATAATSKVSSGTQVGAIETGSSGSGSGSGSSDDATATETASQGGDSGGSPTGIASSQASLEESATVAPSVSASTFYPGATGSAGVIPVPGNNGTYVTSAAPPAASGGSGSGSGSGNGAGSAASPSTTSPSVDTGAANSLQSKGAFSAAFLAVIGAVLAL